MKHLRNIYNVLILQDQEGLFVSRVAGLSGCEARSQSLDDLMKMTKEAMVEYLEAGGELLQNRFVGIHQIEI
ncbi:MAG: type II toxin-antitoxin system HicB family antitoxin [Candidatus Aenigmarchaeota archaeon]|nr:type II toxin-antitoxin system HicB family antitoxin [Candidatus Aenigmarchaeota archaeon]